MNTSYGMAWHGMCFVYSTSHFSQLNASATHYTQYNIYYPLYQYVNSRHVHPLNIDKCFV